MREVYSHSHKRKTAKKNAKKALARERAAVEAAQARLDAERAAFQLQGGSGLDRVEQARAASAAIEDPELRKRHQALVRVAAAGVGMLVAAPDAGTAGAADWSPETTLLELEGW